jgi:pilus assembly protein CpaB
VVPPVTLAGDETLKRSNRLVLLVGVLLAVVAFGGVFAFTSRPPAPGAVEEPTIKTVLAKQDIPLGSRVDESMLKVEEKKAADRAAGSYSDPGLVIGKIARKNILAGQQLTTAIFQVATGPVTELDVPPGKRAMAVQVDQVSGVGTLIRAGDYVDLIVAFSTAQFPVITVSPEDGSINPVAGLNGTSVKMILQGMQVLNILLPPPPAPAEGQPATGNQGTALTGQQAILLLAVTPQQAEVIKFAQMDGSMTVVLRSPADFLDENNQPRTDVEPDVTTGVILKSLVDEYGLLVPELILTVLPEASPAPN